MNLTKKFPNSVPLIIYRGVGLVITTATWIYIAFRCGHIIRPINTIIAKQTIKNRTVSNSVPWSWVTAYSSSISIWRRPGWRCWWSWSNLSWSSCWICCQIGSQKLHQTRNSTIIPLRINYQSKRLRIVETYKLFWIKLFCKIKIFLLLLKVRCLLLVYIIIITSWR